MLLSFLRPDLGTDERKRCKGDVFGSQSALYRYIVPDADVRVLIEDSKERIRR